MVLAFRRHAAPDSRYTCALREIDPAAEYEVTLYPEYTPAAPVRMKGAALATIPLEISGQPGSLLMEYRQIR
jgi:hypothetical protein